MDQTATAIRLLAVGADPTPFGALDQYARDEGVTIAHLPDSESALRAIGEGAWSALVVPLGDNPAATLRWWERALETVSDPPRVIALATAPSIALQTAGRAAFDI